MIGFGMIFRHPTSSLTAATTAVLVLVRRHAQVLRRIMVELVFARCAAEEIRFSLVLGVSGGGGRFYVHAADWISYNCCTRHCVISLVRKSS
jgi:hypothetical protein